MKVSFLFLLFLIAFNQCVFAIDDIQVAGLFRDKAVVLIDGSRHVLSIGEQSPQGVRLIEADSKRAILEFDGKRGVYPLGNRVHTGFAAPRILQVNVYRSPNGTYVTTGSIDGLPVDFLVDTGATAIAMNSNEARRLGIAYRIVGDKINVNTASGTSSAYSVNLGKVRVGDIEMTNVEAYVLDGEQPGKVLLGMSYLRHLNISNEGQIMRLEKKH